MISCLHSKFSLTDEPCELMLTLYGILLSMAKRSSLLLHCNGRHKLINDSLGACSLHPWNYHFRGAKKLLTIDMGELSDCDQRVFHPNNCSSSNLRIYRWTSKGSHSWDRPHSKTAVQEIEEYIHGKMNERNFNSCVIRCIHL